MRLLYLLIFHVSLANAFAQPLPNILFILTDDLGYGDLSCMGSKSIATPNIDSIAHEGMTLTDFYVHNRCSPTRLAFMTGSHAHRAGYPKVIYHHSKVGIHPHEITTPELLQQAQYRTGIVGKWHLGEWPQFNPTLHGFDYFFGFMYQEKKQAFLYQNQTIVEKLSSAKTDGIYTERLLQAGVEFIKKNKEQPFFLYYASPLPHTKWKPMEKFKGSSKHGTYGDVVQEIDWQVGVLLDTLDELQLSENTLVIFASDNGPQLNVEGHGSAGPLRDGKWSNFEGGVRVPCLVRWPGVVKPKSYNHEITGIVDLLPTLCDLAKIPLPKDRVLDGKSILPYLKGTPYTNPIHDSFIIPGSSIRYKDWKLAVSELKPGGSKRKDQAKSAKAGSLFNLKNDPRETTDVSGSHPEIVMELTKKMNHYMEQLQRNSRKIQTVED